MENYIYYSYLTASVAYVTLFVFVVFNKNRHYPFIIAVLCSAIWSTSVTFATKSSHYFYADTLAHETIRNGAWFFLLGALLSKQRYNNYKQLFKGHTSIAITTFVLIILCLESFPESLKLVTTVIDADPRFAGHVVFAVLGLILVEQLYRSTPLKQRWNLKFLCISLGAVFAVDLLVYSKSLLFNHLDFALWQSRGVTNA
ncbi:hypothetical protein [Methylomonas koyamae]|nr:hypothetical protein [Methylomonas koyamae]